jgi:hypothetical protein
LQLQLLALLLTLRLSELIANMIAEFKPPLGLLVLFAFLRSRFPETSMKMM